jgi:sec-independent protein translocase protein TatC
VLLFGTAAYFVQQHIVNLLLRPAHGQHFIYTSPGGGIGFLFEICTDVGLILSLPLVIYEILGFLAPLLDHKVRRFIGRCVAVSAVLGALGVAFGYFLGLPLALHFLSHQFSTAQITPLLTISEYMSFVTIYLGGSALLFQIPLVLMIINRIKPLSPRRLLGYERWVIVIAFVVSALMAPTINVIDQLVIAGPVILAYQVGVGLIWWLNRRPRRPKHVVDLMERDRLNQAERLRRAAEARTELSRGGLPLQSHASQSRAPAQQ